MKPVGLFVLMLVVSSCAPSLTREGIIETAHAYTQVEWMPEKRHILHGKDVNGMEVHTPDRTLLYYEERGGWWTPKEPAKSMPYKWGGFDTPETFLTGLKKGKKAGDVATMWKKQNGDAAVSTEAVGIDCSGFISRCWNLPRPYSTRELPQICDRLESWDDLRTGDILLKPGHVLLFEKWNPDRSIVIGYEAGPVPYWRVHAFRNDRNRLEREGYTPWGYRGMPKNDD